MHVAAERQAFETAGRETSRMPMGTAAFELQKRLKQLIENGMLYNFTHGRPETTAESDREYAMMSTLYAFGDFFGWCELVRKQKAALRGEFATVALSQIEFAPSGQAGRARRSSRTFTRTSC